MSVNRKDERGNSKIFFLAVDSLSATFRHAVSQGKQEKGRRKNYLVEEPVRFGAHSTIGREIQVLGEPTQL